MKNAIVMMSYSEHWPDEFNRIGAELRSALGDLALRIDHIGSTSVPGLAAKDVVDIQITVATLDAAAIASALSPLGYVLSDRIGADHIPARMDERPDEWRKLFARVPEGQRRTHVHIRQAGRANQRYALLFRDFLRTNPAAAGSYLQIKEALARLHPEDIDAYYDVKDPVCDLIIAAAEYWANATGYVPGPSDR